MKHERGQAVLIVLLVMVVALTVVLSIIASTTSDIKISTTENTSLRAFSAAEAGIQQSLLANTSSNGTVSSGASFNAVVTGLAQGATSYVYPNNLLSGEAGIVWFVSHQSNGSFICDLGNNCFTGNIINMCWGNKNTSPSSPTTPALQVSFFYQTTPGDPTTTQIARAIFDPNTGRQALNSYASVDTGTCSIGTNQFAFQKQIDLSTLSVPSSSYTKANGLQFAIVKMIYNTDTAQPFGISVNFPQDSSLPPQGSVINSTGTLNQATRKVEAVRAYGGVPPVFDSAVFSPGALVQ